jgi:hypothetical protein
LQTSDCGFDVHVTATNEQNELKNQGFVWIGKSSFILRDFRPNVSHLKTDKVGNKTRMFESRNNADGQLQPESVRNQSPTARVRRRKHNLGGEGKSQGHACR